MYTTSNGGAYTFEVSGACNVWDLPKQHDLHIIIVYSLEIQILKYLKASLMKGKCACPIFIPQIWSKDFTIIWVLVAFYLEWMR